METLTNELRKVIKTSMYVFVAALLSISLISCNQQNNAIDSDDKLGEEISEEVESTMEKMEDKLDIDFNNKSELEEWIDERSLAIEQKMEKIENDMENASADAKAEMQEQWNSLKKIDDELEKSAKKVADATEQNWNEVKKEVEEAMESIENEIDS